MRLVLLFEIHVHSMLGYKTYLYLRVNMWNDFYDFVDDDWLKILYT